VHLRIRGKLYDVLTLCPRKGPERKVYFNISQPAEAAATGSTRSSAKDSPGDPPT
jgi:hypothetical protein